MITCLSVSHKNASLPMLETLNISDDKDLARSLYSENIVQECVLLQTCHRVEIYCVLTDSKTESAVKQILKSWSAKTGVSLDLISKTVNLYHGRAALTHLFYLACGLESMVLGEDQILGQVRIAYTKAKENGTARMILEKAFMKAINTGRRVRTETRINEGSVSVSSAAVDLAAKELGSLDSIKALIIGAGETGAMAAETLRRKSTASIIVANRTYEKGEVLAKKVSGKAIKFNRIQNVIPEADLVIVAVAVTQPILRKNQLESVVAKIDNSRTILLIDISQPRAIEEKVGLLRGFSLKTIDDLKGTVDENIKNRQIEAEKSKIIICEELDRFEIELAKLLAQPLISEICRKFEEIRQKELARAIRKLGESDEKKIMVLERFSRELIERIAQMPIEQLRKASLNSNGTLLSAAEELFQTRS